MPHNEILAGRIRRAVDVCVQPNETVTERKMFGGLCFLLDGKMAAGVETDRLMIRMEPDEVSRALDAGTVQPMDFSGKPMRNFAFVMTNNLTDTQLERWVSLSLNYARRQPPPKPKKPRIPKGR
ncbi:TfoX/Sxy family protein [Kamptonema cortianum]|nr:TfoX/Sxy family protein [Geitlerinema splendidum]MDK3156231.1 TfoX/Sxy family protein [Kamptonema cortianum]